MDGPIHVRKETDWRKVVLPRRVLCALCAWMIASGSVQAGMTVYGLKDVHRLRLEELSFFIFLLLVCGLIFRLIWNHAIKGFGFLPRIGYLQSVCLCTVLGMGTLLILTMISGIREVLTPEAWRRQGSSYRLNDPSQEPARIRSLEQPRRALFDYAQSHEGRFPPHDFVPEIPDKLWEAPDQLGTHYLYRGGLTTSDTNQLLAAEPPNFGESRFVLSVSGEIYRLESKAFSQKWRPETTP